MEEEKEVIVSYETLFELLRREKEREALQKLDKEFFMDLVDYLNGQKRKDLEQTPEEERSTEKEIENIKRLIKDLYEKREKKLVNLALDKVRTGSELLDTSPLLDEEKKIFELILRALTIGRGKILANIIKGALPEEITDQEIKTAKSPQKERIKDTKLLRFLHAVPKFLGKELEEYGPFEEEDVASLPIEIADVLITKGRAEEIDEY